VPITVQVIDVIKILIQAKWAPQVRGPLCFAHAAQSIATPLSHDGRCHLRSAASRQLSGPSTMTNYGDCSFAGSGPTVWNSLPAVLQLDMSLSVFHTRLKTFSMT